MKSAQCKSAVVFCKILLENWQSKKSRNHTELLFKYLKLPIKILEKKNYDIIRIRGKRKIPALNYKIPSDISSAAFFIVLTALSKKSKLKIKNVIINPSRTGILRILKLMGIKILKSNIRAYKGEKIADLTIKSSQKINPINCPSKFKYKTDLFLLIFLVVTKNWVSYFKIYLNWIKKSKTKMGI